MKPNKSNTHAAMVLHQRSCLVNLNETNQNFKLTLLNRLVNNTA